jgi:hypothetical protein
LSKTAPSFALKAHRKLACGVTTGKQKQKRFRSERAAEFEVFKAALFQSAN